MSHRPCRNRAVEMISGQSSDGLPESGCEYGGLIGITEHSIVRSNVRRTLTLGFSLVLGTVVQAAGPEDAGREWPFDPPRNVKPPTVETDGWLRNGIDAFVYSKLADQGLKPAPEASREQLVRRLYLDLIGLPPSPADVDRFVSDTAGNAYERLVDRLLKHPAYGERWARLWLDLARYADTAG